MPTTDQQPGQDPQAPGTAQDDPQEPQGPAGAPEDDQDPQEGTEDAGERESGNREAAKYRRRLREAEAETEALRTRVAALEADQFDQLATEHGIRPAALAAAGYSLQSFQDDAGQVDATKVAAAVTDVTERFGLAPVNPPGYVGSQGTGEPHVPMSGWAGVLNPGHY